MMLRPVVGLGIVLVTLAFEAQAQLRVVPQSGDVVRIESSSTKGRFVVESTDSDLIVLHGLESGELHSVSLQSITRLDVRSERSRGGGFLRGAGWGFIAGGLVGVGAGFASGDDKGGFMPMSAGEKAGVMGIVLGGAGALIGGVVGLASPGHRWERVHVQRIALTPGSNGSSVSLALSF